LKKGFLMLDDKNPAGASRPPDQESNQIKGELLATFAVLKSTYGLERLELAWLVMMALGKHIQRHEGLDEWVNFTARLSDMSAETTSEIDRILHADAKAQGRYH